MNARGVHRRRRGGRWRWPAATAVALACLAASLLVPRAWLGWLLDPAPLRSGSRRELPAPWLTLLPPPEVEVVPAAPAGPREPRPSPPRPPDAGPADWWRRGWRIRVAEAAAPGAVLRPRPTAEDSARLLLRRLGVDGDPLRLARPDSVLAARLLLLSREESWRFDALEPYLGAMARARAYADLQSRVAAMYDDFLASDIIVPD